MKFKFRLNHETWFIKRIEALGWKSELEEEVDIEASSPGEAEEKFAIDNSSAMRFLYTMEEVEDEKRVCS